MLEAVQLPAGVADLDTGLADVNGDNLWVDQSMHTHDVRNRRREEERAARGVRSWFAIAIAAVPLALRAKRRRLGGPCERNKMTSSFFCHCNVARAPREECVRERANDERKRRERAVRSPSRAVQVSSAQDPPLVLVTRSKRGMCGEGRLTRAWRREKTHLTHRDLRSWFSLQEERKRCLLGTVCCEGGQTLADARD